MARPARPGVEAELVRSAASGLAVGLSHSRQAERVAALVVQHLAADMERHDPFDRAMAAAQRLLSADPALQLATCPAIALAAEWQAERVRCFEARECRQIGPAEWRTEGAAIAAKMRVRLSRRFRRHL